VSSVEVIVPLVPGHRRLIASRSFARATAGLVDGPGVLTVEWLGPPVPELPIAATFGPEQWRSVTVYDDRGYPEFTFTNPAFEVIDEFQSVRR
jgi:hypothetical protein